MADEAKAGEKAGDNPQQKQAAPGEKNAPGKEDGATGKAGAASAGTSTTLRQTVVLAVALAVVTVVVACLWFYTVDVFDDRSRVEVNVPWTRPSAFVLQPGPACFRYDDETKQLRHLGLINDGVKTQLVALADETADANQLEAVASYCRAIEKLAYQSETQRKGLFAFSLLVGGLSGVLGVQLRSIANLIGVKCYKNALDISGWWPWYALRPIVGFLLGIILILMIEGGLMAAGELNAGNMSWRLGVALLAGFGSTDFTDRLRLIAKGLFGEASKTESQNKPGTKPNET